MQAIIAILISIILALPIAPVWATDRYAHPSGSGSTCSVGSPCSLPTALSLAVAGDNVILQDGNFTANYTANNSGSSGNPITIKAVNRHQANLSRTGDGCSPGSSTSNLTLNGSWYIVEDIRTTGGTNAIWLNNSDNTILRRNMITKFNGEGIQLRQGTSNTTITQNVIGFNDIDDECQGQEAAAIRLFSTSSAVQNNNNTISHNIILSNIDDDRSIAQQPGGHGIEINYRSNFNNVLGNAFLAAGSKGSMTILCGDDPQCHDNILRGNIVAWGTGGNFSTNCRDDSNTFSNNLIVGEYDANLHTKGNISPETYGHHTFEGNTVIMDPRSRVGINLGFGNGEAACIGGGRKIANTMKNNVFEADFALSSPHHALLQIGSEGSVCAFCDYNVYSSPTSDGKFVDGYTPQGNETVTTSAITFVDRTGGNYQIASGPGFNACESGINCGIAYDSELKLRWSRYIFGRLPEATATGLTTSYNASVASGHEYIVWFHVPLSPCSDTAHNFTIEGETVARNISQLHNQSGIDWMQAGGAARWAPLGSYAVNDGTLTVTWGSSSCADGIWWQQLPTETQADSLVNPSLYPVSVASAVVEDATPTIITVNLDVSGLAPLVNSTCAGFSVTEDASPVTISSTAKTGDTQCELTLASGISGGTTVLLDYAPFGDSAQGVLSDTLIELAATDDFSVTNNVEGGAPSIALTQATGRFYCIHRGEGLCPVGQEASTSFAAYPGDQFRWRVGVRATGDNAISQAYALYAQICDPSCGSVTKVTADSSVAGVGFINDQVQSNNATLTNQLGLGGLTFQSGTFIEQASPAPTVAITQDHQFEWEYALQIDRSAVTYGDTVKLLVQTDAGVALDSYTYQPVITISPAGKIQR